MKTFLNFYNEIKSLGLEPSDENAGRSTHKISRYKKGDDGYFVKFPKPELQSIIEHLTYKIYKLYNIKVPDSYLVVDENNESIGIATKGVSGNLAMSHKPLVGHKDIYDGFFVDAFLANWDVMGLFYDNIILSKDTAYRIDPGGSLTFRAQGGRKGERFGHDPGELSTFLNKNLSPQASSVFSNMQKHDMSKAAKVFESVPWSSVEKTIDDAQYELSSKIKELKSPEKQVDILQEANKDFTEVKEKLKSRYIKILQHIKDNVL